MKLIRLSSVISLLGLVGYSAGNSHINLVSYPTEVHSHGTNFYHKLIIGSLKQGVDGTIVFDAAYFGSKQEKGYLLIDTLATYTAVNDIACSECQTKVYSPVTSTSAVQGPLWMNKRNGFFTMNGMEWTDNVIIHNSNQSTNYSTSYPLRVISLNQPTADLPPELGGVIGLGYSLDEDQQTTLKHILPADHRTFAVMINATKYDVFYGGYSDDLIAKGDRSEGYGIHWFNLHNDKDSWSIPLQDARYGYMSFLRGNADKAVIATGLRFIHIPKEDFVYLGGLWQDKIATVNCEDETFCFIDMPCSDVAQLIGPFKIQFDTYEYFSVEPERYLFEGTDFGHPNACVFGVFAHTDDTPYKNQYVLGVPFIENYYSIFDQDQGRIGLALHIYSDAAIRETFSWWVILLIALGVMVVFPLFVLGLYFIYKIRRNKRRALEGNQSTLEASPKEFEEDNGGSTLLLQKDGEIKV